MKKKKQSQNGGKPVTLQQLNQALKPVFGKFKQIDKRFEKADTDLSLLDRRITSTNIRIDAVERALGSLEHTMKDQFNALFNHIDAFMKRIEVNEREILFLGKQHDDLAKYCTAKIAYPTYGRNL